MTIAVTDASIFIDLIESDACGAFFRLPYQIVTSYQIWMELDPEQRNILSVWIDSGQLTIIRIKEDFVKGVQPFNLSLSLSVADRSAWFLAKKKGAILLTSDRVLRKMGRQHGIKTHGLLWIFDRMVEKQTLNLEEAISSLQFVFDQNLYYRRNQKLLNAFERLKKKWQR